jgi:hypothetical protein
VGRLTQHYQLVDLKLEAQGVILSDESDDLRQLTPIPLGDISIVDLNRSSEREETADCSKKRRFSASVRTDNAHETTPIELERDAGQDGIFSSRQIDAEVVYCKEHWRGLSARNFIRIHEPLPQRRVSSAMSKWISKLSVVLLVVTVSGGCDSQEAQREFEADANLPPSGIAVTDENGTILQDDPDDWRTSPAFAGVVRFEPAYANPTAGNLVTVPVVVQQFNALPGGLELRGFDDTDRLVLLDDLPQATQPGSYTFVFSPSQFSVSGNLSSIRGLHRVFVFGILGSSEVVSYGDIQVD